MTARKPRGYRRLRWAIQLTLLVLFAVLLARTRYGIAPNLTDIFFRFDPLVFAVVSIATRTLVAAGLLSLVVVVATLLFGRFFCGFVCPLGTTIDLADAAFRRKSQRATNWKWGKFLILIFLLVSAALGASFVGFFDPLAIFSRTLTLVGFPVITWFGGLVAGVRPAVFTETLLALATFLVIIGLGFIAPRFWCRNLCPLGALLGFLGKASPVRLAVSEKCTRCLRCVNECKTGAIMEDPHRYRGTECIACFTCVAICPEKAISLTVRRADADRDDALQLDRRRVLQAAGLGVAALVLPKVDWTGRFDERKVTKFASDKLIRPPGALPEEPFVTACVRCGECMKICPTNALQPALGEGGLQALGTPIVVPRIGPCAQACNLCGQVCPTRAIEPFTIEEKDHLYLGTAMVDRSLCIAWAADKQCLICDEACSYRAISQKTTEGVGRPVIDEHVCVGCGLCERACPIQPQAAIHVYASGDKRHLSRVEQAAWRQQAQQEPAGESPYSQQAGREGPG